MLRVRRGISAISASSLRVRTGHRVNGRPTVNIGIESLSLTSSTEHFTILSEAMLHLRSSSFRETSSTTEDRGSSSAIWISSPKMIVGGVSGMFESSEQELVDVIDDDVDCG